MELYDLGHMILCESGLDWTRPQFLFFLLSKSIHFDELWDQFNPNPNYLIMTSHFKLAITIGHMSHPFSIFFPVENLLLRNYKNHSFVLLKTHVISIFKILSVPQKNQSIISSENLNEYFL